MAVNFSSIPAFRGFRAEADVFDCEVIGELPSGLRGTFYRVGPDWLYPPTYANDIPFNGDGHAQMFRIADGHVDFRSRYVKTQRYKAHHEARRGLFGTYRNRYTDDPSVRDLSGGTANTHIVYHHGKLLSLKEDSPPVVLDPHTLETLDDYYTFNGELTSKTFTAHPKFDAQTGEMLAFGYEARGEDTRDVAVYSFDANGRKTWEAWVRTPYVSMLHDFAITATHIAFLAIPYVVDVERMKAGEVHWAWDSTKPTWFGVMRRGGDGSDIRWYKGPERCATHVMNAWSEGERIFVDMDMANKGQFPFFPYLHGEHFDPKLTAGRITRLSVDLNKHQDHYDMEVLYPDVTGVLPRQDDRYHGIPYKVGFMPRFGWTAQGPETSYTRFDHDTRKTTTYIPGKGIGLAEPCFVPRRKDAPEGDGWVVGVANLPGERNISELQVMDAEHLDEGPIARVRLPFKAPGQVHGWWVPDWELPV
ncbi:MAG: carotenoid oxygenase family protein [Gammaproteobacteria bacterium]|nr:carotenoid oxygenase family protein [Gammaproteobacteria bacterium]